MSNKTIDNDVFEWMLGKLMEKGYTRTQLIDMSDDEIEKAYEEINK